MVMFKKIKTFALAFSEPGKVYSSGERVTGLVTVEVTEVTHVTAVRLLACGVAKVLWIKGPQQCKQEMEYLHYEDVLRMDDRPTGEHLSVAKCKMFAKFVIFFIAIFCNSWKVPLASICLCGCSFCRH